MPELRDRSIAKQREAQEPKPLYKPKIAFSRKKEKLLKKKAKREAKIEKFGNDAVQKIVPIVFGAKSIAQQQPVSSKKKRKVIELDRAEYEELDEDYREYKKSRGSKKSKSQDDNLSD
ncbi:hypothetical protein Ciccas_004292 [Cichlidogyrus casuarinus]|uniref:Uncharacterized protein n=1 Tax=Cichlidogyrus casuarinus TaxID=1844966 RepID=A0ABD2QC02_9PLAT